MLGMAADDGAPSNWDWRTELWGAVPWTRAQQASYLLASGRSREEWLALLREDAAVNFRKLGIDISQNAEYLNTT